MSPRAHRTLAVSALAIAVAMTATMAPTAALGAAVCDGGIVRVSVATDGTQADGISLEPSISGPGRHVAFFSDATNLVTHDTNGWGEIFVHDVDTGVTTRASVSDTERQGDRQSLTQDISDDGNLVAFGSSAGNLVRGDTNDLPDTFVRDLAGGTTTRVSVSSTGAQGREGGSSTPSLSRSGAVVGFWSVASNLAPGDRNGIADVYVHDQRTGRTQLVSIATDGRAGNDQSGIYAGPSLSATGRFVAFESDASNLVAGDTNRAQDVFVRDRRTRTTTRVSVDAAGGEGVRESYWPSVSATGRFVAFATRAPNLVPGDTNRSWDIVVKDRRTGAVSRVSVSSRGRQGNAFSYSPAISATGQVVAFWSYADNLVPGDTNGVADVFVHDRRSGRTVLVSRGCAGAPANGESLLPAISDDGTVVAFESAATNLVPDDTNGVNDIFVAVVG